MHPGFDVPRTGPVPRPWHSPHELLQDPAIPALGAIRTMGLAEVLPELALADGPVELRPCNYVPGSRATFEARVGGERFAIKLYAEDPSPEADLYRWLARAGLARERGPRAPRLLAWDSRLRVLVLSWLDGPTAHALVKEGKGDRAGELAASWLRHISRRRMKFGPHRGRGHMLYQAGVSAGAISVVQPSLGAAAKRVAKMLTRVRLAEGPPGLVHGTFYARHIFDLGDGPGVIDWQQFGVGPIEADAGMFLATISRLALRHAPLADEVERTKRSFLDRTRRLVDDRTLEWYWAAGLLHLSATGLKTAQTRKVPEEAPAIIAEAEDHARSATEGLSVGLRETSTILARFRGAVRPRPPAPENPPSDPVASGGLGSPDGKASEREE